MKAPKVVPAALVAAALCTSTLFAQDHAHPAGDHVLGDVDFPTSCSAAAQAEFQGGVAMLHSFWFPEARLAFERAAAADASCAMPHWGLAITRLGNPMARVSPPPEGLAEGLAHARRALELSARATPREQDYARAAVALYDGYETADHFERMRRYEDAMRATRDRSPDDVEATIFYGLAVVANAPPTDLTFARQLEGASLLLPLFERFPNHPGLAHYVIHAFDAPPIAERGLAAAQRYAGIAPSAPHALHMPSHIFTRLGHWTESAETNARSAEAESNPRGRYHPWDYMVYAYLQQGKDAAARQVAEGALQVERDARAANPEGYDAGTVAYNLVAMPARLALERSAWSEAAALEPFTGTAPYVEAVSRFAKGVGLARTGDAAGALREAARLDELAGAQRATGDAYWPVVMGAQALAVRAWAAHAGGEHAEAARLARQAAELEETVEKHPVTPGPILPARELYADLLAAHGQPAEALVEYQATLAREPNRARSLAGAAAAAQAAGRRDVATGYYRLLVEQMQGGDGARPEVRTAQEHLRGGR